MQLDRWAVVSNNCAVSRRSPGTPTSSTCGVTCPQSMCLSIMAICDRAVGAHMPKEIRERSSGRHGHYVAQPNEGGVKAQPAGDPRDRPHARRAVPMANNFI